MKSHLKWMGAMKFTAESDAHVIAMDAKSPLGQDTAQTPKELVAAGLAGCTAMDVVALLKKHKQTPQTLEVTANIVMSTGKYPAVFESALLNFEVTGSVDKNILLESVMLSQTKYCGVSAMLAKAFPINYKVFLNGEEVGTGKANFEGELL